MKMLRRDGRLTYRQIARTAGVSEPTARKRMDRLLGAGAIVLGARINPAPIGFPVDAFVGIHARAGRATEVGRQLAGMEHVAYLGHLAGGFDMLAEVFLPDTEGLFRFLHEDLEHMGGIASTDTWPVLRTEKSFYSWEGESVGLDPAVRPQAPPAPLVRQGSLPHGTLRLDDLDRQVMKLLRHDARLTLRQIARTTGVSEPTARKRVDRLLAAGAIILGARIDPAPIGFPVDVFVAVRVGTGRVTEVGRKLAAMEHIAYLAYLAGGFDIIAEAYLVDAEGLFRFLHEDLERIDGITATATWPVLRTEKYYYEWEGESVGLERADRPATVRPAADEEPRSAPADDERPDWTHRG